MNIRFDKMLGVRSASTDSLNERFVVTNHSNAESASAYAMRSDRQFSRRSTQIRAPLDRRSLRFAPVASSLHRQRVPQSNLMQCQFEFRCR